jgi:general secretion pathway protein G
VRARARGSPGFSAFELAVLISIVAAALLFLSSRLQAVRIQAERITMEHVLGALRSAVTVEFASHVVRGTQHDLTSLEGTNPIDRLAEIPGNYLGAFDAPDPWRIDEGYWYFDLGQRLLVYRVRHKGSFETSLPGPARAQFKLEFLYADRNLSGKYEPAEDELQGLTVAPVEAYRWIHSGNREEQGRR